MGAEFGGLYKLYGIVTYKVSPMYLQAYYGFFKHGIPNNIRRCMDQAPYVLPPFLLGCGVFYSMEALHDKYARKSPDDFCDEEDD